VIDEPIHVLHEWQQLLGATIGALALVITVWSILSAERRRRNEEARSLRVALGTELRQIAKHALAVQEDVLKLLPPVNQNLVPPARTIRDLQSVLRFPDAVVYSHVGSGLGSLGEYTHHVVLFYNQVWKIRDTVSQSWTSSSQELQMLSVPSSQLLEVAGSLLNAIGTATGTFPGLADGRSSAADEEFQAQVSAANERLAALRKSFAFRI
jgi:hypothetical protein